MDRRSIRRPKRLPARPGGNSARWSRRQAAPREKSLVQAKRTGARGTGPSSRATVRGVGRARSPVAARSIDQIDGALAIAAFGHVVDVIFALVAQLVRIFGPGVAAVLDIARAAQVAGELLLRFGDVDAIVEPEIVLDPGDRGLEDQFLFGARDLLVVERGDRGLRSTCDEAEGEQRRMAVVFIGVSPSCGPAPPAGRKKRIPARFNPRPPQKNAQMQRSPRIKRERTGPIDDERESPLVGMTGFEPATPTPQYGALPGCATSRNQWRRPYRAGIRAWQAQFAGISLPPHRNAANRAALSQDGASLRLEQAAGALHLRVRHNANFRQVFHR